jgi:hypothetical protein
MIALGMITFYTSFLGLIVSTSYFREIFRVVHLYGLEIWCAGINHRYEEPTVDQPPEALPGLEAKETKQGKLAIGC